MKYDTFHVWYINYADMLNLFEKARKHVKYKNNISKLV